MKLNFNWSSFLMGVSLGAFIVLLTDIFSETPEQRHARRMEEIKEFAAIAPLAAMIFKAQNGN